MRTTTRSRANAPAVFGSLYAEVAHDARCGPVAASIRSHAVEVACLARELAPLMGSSPGDAFAAGLLHDVGQLILMRRDPSCYIDLLRGGALHGDLLRLEKAAYDTDHALLGAEYLLDLRMPDSVADAVADHHDPFVSSSPTTIVVAAADELLGADARRRHAVDLLDLDDGAMEGRRDP